MSSHRIVTILLLADNVVQVSSWKLDSQKDECIDPMLWCTDNKRWDGEWVRKICGREPNDILKSTLNILSHRYVAIVIAWKHLQKNYYERMTVEDDNEGDLQVANSVRSRSPGCTLALWVAVKKHSEELAGNGFYSWGLRDGRKTFGIHVRFQR